MRNNQFKDNLKDIGYFLLGGALLIGGIAAIGLLAIPGLIAGGLVGIPSMLYLIVGGMTSATGLVFIREAKNKKNTRDYNP